MGWSNQQSTTLDGQAFNYTNTTVEYGTGSSLTIDSSAQLDVEGDLTVNGTFTANGTTALTGVNVITGTTAMDGTVLIHGHEPALGLLGRNLSTGDQPAAGSAATTITTADTVLTCRATVKAGRNYLVSAPGLSVRMNVAARTGVVMIYTLDGSAPTPTHGFYLGSQYVNCPTVGSPVPCPLSYSIGISSNATLRVFLGIWNVSGGGATVANGSGTGPNPNLLELLIADQGTDPGLTP